MGKKLLLQLMLTMSFFSNANSEIRITEIMTNNVSTIVSDSYNYDGYVEFYNDGDNVDLKGWTVTNEKNEEIEWSVVLDSSHVLPNGYSLLFFGKDKSSSATASQVHKNYAGNVGMKMTTEGGIIRFSKGDRNIELSYPKQYPHIAYCSDGYMVPTPGAQNDELVTTISNRVASPAFKDNKPGMYTDSLGVELECSTDGALIYYTDNGNVPTPDSGKVYNGAIPVGNTTVIRARAYKDGKLFSEILTGTFVLPDKFYESCKGVGKRLPIVSISGNNHDIFGDSLGFYVVGKNGVRSGCYESLSNYNRDWMRSVNFEYILDGSVVDNQEVEVGVYGGCTRIHKAKSLKIKANKRSGKAKMQYNNFFPSREYKKYKSLALRNGGNGYSYVQPRWRDMFIQSLGDGMNLDRQMAQPVAYYLNGIFYGMMILTERTNEDYVYHNYGLDEEEIDMLSSGYNTYVCEIGTKDAYNDMIEYVGSNYNEEDYYDKLGEMIDIDEYIDYQILEQYIGNTDWVTNNTKIWRKHDGGKFRWILFDTDFGLSKATTVDKDMIKFATSEKGKEPVWRLLKSSLQNEDFRWRFLDQYLDRIEHQFTDERIDTKLDSIWDLTRLDMCATIKNASFLEAPGDTAAFRKTVEEMRTFAKERKSYVIQQLKEEFGLGDDSVTIKIRTSFPESETPDFKFLFNKREIVSSKYNTWRYSGERIKIEPIVPAGYKIRKWAVNDTTVRSDNGRYEGDYLVQVAKNKELKITVYFDYDPDYVLPTELCLNEVCATNTTLFDENGKASDWIEIYNGAEGDVDLAGMVIENVTKEIAYTIPSGSSETVVPAHGYKLLWADKTPENGPLHLNFKLSKSASETVVLTAYYRDTVMQNTLTYEAHEDGESFGRVEDGLTNVTLFNKCVDSEGNDISTSTPMAPNGSVVCQQSSLEQAVAYKPAVQIYVDGRNVVLNNLVKESKVEVYSLLGVLISEKTADSDIVEITVPAPGVYLVKVGTECRKVIVE